MDISINKPRTLSILALLLTLLLTLSVTIAPCYAFSLTSWYMERLWWPVLSIGGGAAISSNNIGNARNFPIKNPFTDEFYFYSAQHSTPTVGIADIFLGTEWGIQSNWMAQTGIGYNQTSSFVAKGSFLQGADIGSADLYAYRYHVIGRQLLASGKLFYQLSDYYPYVYAGVGASFNDAHHYHTNVPVDLAFTRLYARHTTAAFSYAVGAGVDMDVQRNMRVGIGYRFADLGQFSLGHAKIDNTTVSGTLNQTHLYVNEVIAQLTWIFC